MSMYGYVGLCMGLYGYEEFFKLLKGYILLACSALKVERGYHSKRLEPFL